MGFCDMCGAHLDIYDTCVSLDRTDMVKYKNYDLTFVCLDCLNKIREYDKIENPFKDFHFAKDNVKKIFMK